MALTWYTTSFRETLGTTAKQWEVASGVAGGFVVCKIDYFVSLGFPAEFEAGSGTIFVDGPGATAVEIINAGTGQYDIGTNLSDGRSLAVESYGKGQRLAGWPDSTTDGLAAEMLSVEGHWRGVRYYASSSDIWFAWGQATTLLDQLVPVGWVRVGVWA